jgi:hypothetical protein
MMLQYTLLALLLDIVVDGNLDQFHGNAAAGNDHANRIYSGGNALGRLLRAEVNACS